MTKMLSFDSCGYGINFCGSRFLPPLLNCLQRQDTRFLTITLVQNGGGSYLSSNYSKYTAEDICGQLTGTEVKTLKKRGVCCDPGFCW